MPVGENEFDEEVEAADFELTDSIDLEGNQCHRQHSFIVHDFNDSKLILLQYLFMGFCFFVIFGAGPVSVMMSGGTVRGA